MLRLRDSWRTSLPASQQPRNPPLESIARNPYDKFLALRKHLAEREWERMKANDSLECRNCHSSESMDLTKQNPRAAQAHERSLFSGEKTCMDCHKGIAHKLPNMSGVPGWQ